MKLLKNEKLKMEKHEPVLRSCWKCNEAHHHLKKVNSLHYCFICGRKWVYNRFIDELFTEKDTERECERKLYQWLQEQGLKVGDSTTKLDKGYRVQVIKVEPIG